MEQSTRSQSYNATFDRSKSAMRNAEDSKQIKSLYGGNQHMKRSHYSTTAYGRMRDRIAEREKQKREERKKAAYATYLTLI